LGKPLIGLIGRTTKLGKLGLGKLDWANLDWAKSSSIKVRVQSLAMPAIFQPLIKIK